MEELLQHCMHALAFDGDVGCDIDRLKIFIRNYYEELQPSVQNLDDAFSAFVWRLLCQQPSVQIKLIKESSLEVYIAPQKSKKAEADKRLPDAGEQPTSKGGIEVINEAKSLHLTEALQTYGDNLRISVDPETCFRALTGSHIRQPKLTPMVYTALQLISRYREEGLSVVDLGKKTGYDQKTCFYLIKQLLSMDYIVKLAKGGPGGGNFCIHKSFYMRSPFWQGIRDKTSALNQDQQEEAGNLDKPPSQYFDQIDSRHLASPEFIRSRIIKLLKMSENGLHYYHNLLVTIGFDKPSKKDRRFFNIHIRELIKEKVIEKVLVPRKGKPGSKPALCIRLVEDPRNSSLDGVVVQNDDVGDEEQGQGEEGPESSRIHDDHPPFAEAEIKMPLVHMTIQRQIVQLLEEAGANGLILTDISTRLGAFDKRTLDLMLHRLANSALPHLADLGICVFMESLGRERRNRYFTFVGYDEFIRNVNIDVTERPTSSNTVNKTQRGGFNVVSPETFYGDEKELTKYQDKYCDRTNPQNGPPRKIGRPRKSEVVKAAGSTTAGKLGMPSKPDKKRRRSGGVSTEPSPSTSVQKKSKRARLSKDEDASMQEAVVEPPSGDLSVEHVSAISLTASDDVRPTASPKADTMVITSTPDQTINEVVFDSTLANIGQVASSHKGTLGTSEIIVNKRSSDPHDSGEPPTKRLKSEKSKRSAVNLSHLRAENEIIRVVHESGGIANIASKEFFEAHSRVLASLEANGEPISMPVGAQLDRRTLRKILGKLVDRDRLKTLTVTVTPRSVQPRVARLIYTPDVLPEELDNFIKSLQDPFPTVNITVHRELEDAVDFSHPFRSSNLTSQSPTGVSGKPDRAARFRSAVEFVGSDEEIRTRLLADSRTSSQVFGFILGKVRRARELHQFTLQAFSHSTDSSNIVSCRDRIITLSYYFHDIPVATHFSIISASEYNQDLYDIMKTASGREMRVGDLPSSLHEILKIGRARARSRLLDLMEVLMSLGLVTPLRRSDSNTPSIDCSSGGSLPAGYEVASVASDKSSLNKMAFYWQFKELAPIHKYSQSDWPPPFLRDMPVRTADESMAYWDELEKACLEKEELITSAPVESITGPCKCIPSVAQTLRKRSSWSSAYVLSWEQQQYLQNKWTDPLTGYTPLSDEDGGRRMLIHICEIVSAPFDTVYNFFLNSHRTFQKEARRIRGKRQRKGASAAGGGDLEEKAALAKTITDSRQRLASDWDRLVQQVYPGISSRKLAALKDLRTKYIQRRGTASSEEWKSRISEVLANSGLKDRTTLTTRARTTRESQYNLLESTYEGPSVRELIQKLEDSTPITVQERKKRGTEKRSSGTQTRSQRFHWTAEYDELARDASAILRSRCRSWHRMDWTALDQVFSSIPRNNVRQRIATLRQEPGGESYFRRLEDTWYKMWIDHRQTELLPDPNPDHPSDFPLITHIEFLRKNINKNLLKFGSLSSNVEALDCVLSEDISVFLSKWDVTEYPSAADNVDVIWGSAAEEQRENILLRQVFAIERDNPHDLPTQVDHISIAESALKMVLLTPEDDYDPLLASSFLESVGNRPIGLATESLLSQGIISQTGKSDRKTPGRNMRVTDLNQEAVGGFFRPDFYKQALAIDDFLEEDINENKEWDLLSRGGQMAALVDFVSRGEIQFSIDISESIFHRKELDWNSRKVDDDQIETIISILYHPLYQNLEPKSPIASSDSLRTDTALKTHEPHPDSACHLVSNGVINCTSCLGIVHNSFARNTLEETQSYLEIVKKIEAAESNGLSHKTVFDDLIRSDAKRLQLLHSMLSAKPPLCYWTGYNQPILVSARYIRPWTVLLPTPPTTYIFPRRWIDIKGRKTPSLWQFALCAVTSVLFLRPGLSLAELRRKLISVYDRQEVNDILRFLLANNSIAKMTPSKYSEIGEISVSDEEHVALSLTFAERWYDVFKE